MAESELVTLLDNDQVSDYFIEMEKHHSARILEYNKISVWLIEKLKAQKKPFRKISNTIRYTYRVNRVYRHIKNTCADANDMDRTISDYTVQNVLILYIHVTNPWIKSVIKYYIESYNLCNKALLNPHDKFSDEFIDNMLDKTPTYYWECKMRKALCSLDTNLPNFRIETLKEFRADCMSYIRYSTEYITFIDALKLDKKLVKELTLLFIRARDEIRKQ